MLGAVRIPWCGWWRESCVLSVPSKRAAIHPWIWNYWQEPFYQMLLLSGSSQGKICEGLLRFESKLMLATNRRLLISFPTTSQLREYLFEHQAVLCLDVAPQFCQSGGNMIRKDATSVTSISTEMHFHQLRYTVTSHEDRTKSPNGAMLQPRCQVVRRN